MQCIAIDSYFEDEFPEQCEREAEPDFSRCVKHLKGSEVLPLLRRLQQELAQMKPLVRKECE